MITGLLCHTINRTAEQAAKKGKGERIMGFDVKAKVEELAGKLQKDPVTLKSFQDDPIKTVRS